jgi:hypothetical protein
MLACLALVLGAPFFGATDLRAGFGISDLTPPLGLEMGGFGPFLGKVADGSDSAAGTFRKESDRWWI